MCSRHIKQTGAESARLVYGGATELENLTALYKEALMLNIQLPEIKP